MSLKAKLLIDLERVTRTIEYYIGFDSQSETWRILRENRIFGNFKDKKNAAGYAKICATIEYRKKNNIQDLTIDGVSYCDNILEEVLKSDIDLELPEDELI